MKLMFARCCATLIAPHGTDKIVRWCKCHESCCWWDDGINGKFAAYSERGINSIDGLGLANNFLVSNLEGKNYLNSEAIQSLIKEIPPSYVFSQVQSVLIKYKFGYTGDTRFVDKLEDVPLTYEATELKTHVRENIGKYVLLDF